MIGGLDSGVVDHGARIGDEAAHGAGHVIVDGEDLLDARRLDQRGRNTFFHRQNDA